MTSPETPTDPPARALAVARTRVLVAEEGPLDGPPLLLLPGVPGGHLDFRYLAPAISARGVRCIRLELPMFGTNLDAPHHADYSATGRATLLVATADALDLPRFSVLGHSLGGSAALAAAALHPDRVRSLSVLASTGVSRHKGLPASLPVVRAALTIARLPFVWPRAARRIRRVYERLRFVGAQQMTDDEIWVHAQCVRTQDWSENRRHASKVVCPTIVAFADDDPMIEPQIGLELARAMSVGPQVMRWDSGGHALQKKRAPELAPAIARMVRGAHVA